jgi:8-oxo-dGTP pyrophosphatase MutT (NUDIX family)
MARSKQVAALPWRRVETGIEVLLVTTRTTKRWVIPKGWPMNGKADHEAAAIEAYEEAGVRGHIASAPCGHFGYLKISDSGKARHVSVTVYALEVDQNLTDWPERQERERRWLPSTKACAMAGDAELVPVLKAFADHPPKDSLVHATAKKSIWQRLWSIFR